MLGAATIEHSDISERVAQATSDTRALRQLTRLLMTGLAATLMVIAFLFLAGMQAVWLVDQAARDREMAQVIRYINGVPGLQLLSAIVSYMGTGASGFLIGILAAIGYLGARGFLRLGVGPAILMAILVVAAFIGAGMLLFALPAGQLLR